MNHLHGLWFVCCFAVIGCGDHSDSNTAPSPPALTPTSPPSSPSIYLTGNWQIQAILQPVQPPPLQYPRLDIGAALTSSSGQISGVLRVQHGQCGGQKYSPYLGSEAIPVTGTVDSTGNFTVSAASASGTTFTGSGQVSADGQTISSGTFSAYESGCKINSSGTLAGTRLPALGGNWAGTVAFESIFDLTVETSANIVEQLTQSSTADSGGFFPISGTVIGNPPCLSGSTFIVTGSLTGEEGFITLTDTSNQKLTLGIDGFSSGYMHSEGILTNTAAGCTYEHGEGYLSQQ